VLADIQRQIRTQEGKPFDPATVEEDYRAIYALKKFSNVEARVEPAEGGVIVTFLVTEPDVIKEIRFRGNEEVETKTLQDLGNLITDCIRGIDGVQMTETLVIGF